MFTRKDYLRNECSHEEYYAQLVEHSNAMYLVRQRFGVDLLKKKFKKDKHLNNIPLIDWDILGTSIRIDDAHVWESLGDYPTKAGHVCMLKLAARMLINETEL